MRTWMAALVLLVISAQSYTQSCCCTGAGANYSILPNLNRHVIGLRYSYRSFYSEQHSLNPELDGRITEQHSQTVELFGRFNLTQRLQLSVFMPYSFLQQQTGPLLTKNNGPGDLSFLLQYQLINPQLCTGQETKHQLRLGAGTKLPSGSFAMDKNKMFMTNLQLGTGSIDFVFNTIYTLRYKRLGFNASGTYRLNTANPQQYRFGDRTQASVNLFYIFEIKDVSLMPSLGCNYEYQFQNRLSRKVLAYTGGHFLNASLGLDIYYKAFAFSSAFTPALMNRLNWYGENKNKFNIEAGVFYNFSTTKKSNKQ